MAIDPNVNFDQFVKDAIAEQLAAQQNGSGTGAPSSQPEPLQLNVGGQTLSYANKAELEAALNTFVGATGQKFAELQAQASQAQAPAQQGSYVQGNEPTWDNAEFVKHMTEDPKKGFEYAFNQLFFDGKSEAPVEEIKQKLSELEVTKRSISAYQFRENHPEFAGGTDAANKIDQIRQQMGLPYDLNGLDAAYLVGIQRGLLPNYYQQAQAQAYQAQQAQAQQTQEINPYVPQGGTMDPRAWNGGFGVNGQLPYQNNPYLAAPPGVGRGGYAPQAGGIDPESLTTEQIEAVFARAGKPIQGLR